MLVIYVRFVGSWKCTTKNQLSACGGRCDCHRFIYRCRHLDWHEATESYVASDCELGGSAIEAVLRGSAMAWQIIKGLLDQIVISADSEVARQLPRDAPERRALTLLKNIEICGC